MAEKEKQRSEYVYIGTAAWKRLYEHWNRSIPRTVNVEYLTRILQMKEPSARIIVRMLTYLGLIDYQGSVTETALRWRANEAGYREVCAQVIERAYPQIVRSVYEGRIRTFNELVDTFSESFGKGTAENAARFTVFLLKEGGRPEADRFKDPVVRAERILSSSPALRAAPRRKTITVNPPMPVEVVEPDSGMDSAALEMPSQPMLLSSDPLPEPSFAATGSDCPPSREAIALEFFKMLNAHITQSGSKWEPEQITALFEGVERILSRLGYR